METQLCGVPETVCCHLVYRGCVASVGDPGSPLEVIMTCTHLVLLAEMCN